MRSGVSGGEEEEDEVEETVYVHNLKGGGGEHEYLA